jgi:hypothetical protein
MTSWVELMTATNAQRIRSSLAEALVLEWAVTTGLQTNGFRYEQKVSKRSHRARAFESLQRVSRGEIQPNLADIRASCGTYSCDQLPMAAGEISAPLRSTQSAEGVDLFRHVQVSR